MSARRKNVRSQVNEIEIEIDSTDKICKVVDLKGANMIEVRFLSFQMRFLYEIVFSLTTRVILTN